MGSEWLSGSAGDMSTLVKKRERNKSDTIMVVSYKPLGQVEVTGNTFLNQITKLPKRQAGAIMGEVNRSDTCRESKRG